MLRHSLSNQPCCAVCQVLPVLLEAGADWSLLDADGRAPVHWLCEVAAVGNHPIDAAASPDSSVVTTLQDFFQRSSSLLFATDAWGLRPVDLIVMFYYPQSAETTQEIATEDNPFNRGTVHLSRFSMLIIHALLSCGVSLNTMVVASREDTENFRPLRERLLEIRTEDSNPFAKYEDL